MVKSSKRSGYWLYGVHACEAALGNEMRSVQRVLATRNAANRLERVLAAHKVELADGAAIDRAVGADAVHQGIAMLVEPLPPVHLDEVIESRQPLALLDQVTDPHNVGAILRSAAAFGVRAIISPKDHTAPENGALAKAACGALELVPMVSVTNLAHTMGELKAAGYWLAGLDGSADKNVSQLKDYQPVAVVLGAEGKGLRELTRKQCDVIVKIPIQAQMESLNVSNAAAIVFYTSGCHPEE